MPESKDGLLTASKPTLPVIRFPAKKRLIKRPWWNARKPTDSVAIKNAEFRQVLYTAKNCQLVVKALKPKGEIETEVHRLDQFFRVEEGTGEAVLDGVRTAIRAGFAVSSRQGPITTSSTPVVFH